MKYAIQQKIPERKLRFLGNAIDYNLLLSAYFQNGMWYIFFKGFKYTTDLIGT